MTVIELQSGTSIAEEKLDEVTKAVICLLAKYDLLVCDAKEILDITKNKIDGAAKLQTPP